MEVSRPHESHLDRGNLCDLFLERGKLGENIREVVNKSYSNSVRVQKTCAHELLYVSNQCLIWSWEHLSDCQKIRPKLYISVKTVPLPHGRINPTKGALCRESFGQTLPEIKRGMHFSIMVWCKIGINSYDRDDLCNYSLHR